MAGVILSLTVSNIISVLLMSAMKHRHKEESSHWAASYADLLKQLQRERESYTRYECSFCGGKGVKEVAGHVHGHPEKFAAEFPCDVCEGDGHLYKRKVEEAN
jgi:hypothetical protein